MEGVASGGVVLGRWLPEGVAPEGVTLRRLSGSQSPIPGVDSCRLSLPCRDLIPLGFSLECLSRHT